MGSQLQSAVKVVSAPPASSEFVAPSVAIVSKGATEGPCRREPW